MNTEFSAKLQGVNLSDEAKKRIAAGIQDVVLRELAQFDGKGDVIIKRPINVGPINGIVAVEKGGIINVSSLV